LKDSKKGGFELKNAIYIQAIEENIPIFAETSLERTKLIYPKLKF